MGFFWKNLDSWQKFYTTAVATNFKSVLDMWRWLGNICWKDIDDRKGKSLKSYSRKLLGGSFAYCSFCQLSLLMFWTLLEHGGIKVVQRPFISFYCRVSSTTVYVCKKAFFLFGKVRFGVKTHAGLKHCLFFVFFLLLEMCAISTEDACTRLTAEDTCKFHTLSKHDNYLRDDFDDKKSEKGWKLFLNGKHYWSIIRSNGRIYGTTTENRTRLSKLCGFWKGR